MKATEIKLSRKAKEAVLIEIKTIRDKINEYFDMDEAAINVAYAETFPSGVPFQKSPTVNEKRRSLLVRETFYATNVLNLE